MADWTKNLPHYDLQGSEDRLNEVYADARAAGGVGVVGDNFAAFDYATVKTLLAHSQLIPRIVDPSIELTPYVKSRLDEHMLNRNGPDHVRLRRLVSREFTPAAVARHEDSMKAVISELADGLPVGEDFDFMRDFANRIPIMVICDILGMPRDEGEALLDAVHRSGKFFDKARAAENMPDVESGYRDLETYFKTLFDHDIGDMRDGLLKNLRLVEQEGDRLSSQELMMWAQLLFRGGLGNTRHQVGSLIQTLSTRPDQWQLLREQPELAARAVEEGMRLEPAVQLILRQVVDELTVGDAVLPPGTGVLCVTASANRDETVFDAPDTFDATRDPAPGQLLFGGGPHLCPGNLLVKSEVALTLTGLTSRFTSLEPAGNVVMRPALELHGPVSLPIRFAR
ncbi:putative enzyme [metagenome]|uniref:Putative enzyme n=1 Tax=metagenome TaxID=256318 RepID=A0A2P2C4B5_9ZZZZ